MTTDQTSVYIELDTDADRQLLRTLSQILERIVASRLSLQAITCSLIYPLQCSSRAGRSTVNAALMLQQHVQSLHRLRHQVSILFLGIKDGFDNVDSLVLLSLLHHKRVSP